MRYSQLLGVCLVGIVTLLPIRSLHADEQTIAFLDNEALPFKWKENGEYVGPLLDIFREAKRRTGIDFKIVPLPVKRLLYSVERGDVMGAIGITYDPKREVYARYVDVPVGWIEVHGFALKDSKIEFKSIEDLYPLRIGVISGYINAYGQPYKDAVASGKIVPHELRDYVTLLEFLLLNRADIIFAPTGPMDAFISKKGVTDKVKKLPIPIRKAFSLHLMFSRKVSESIPGSADAQKLEAALNSMQRDKAIAAIYKIWFRVFRTRVSMAPYKIWSQCSRAPTLEPTFGQLYNYPDKKYNGYIDILIQLDAMVLQVVRIDPFYQHRDHFHFPPRYPVKS